MRDKQTLSAGRRGFSLMEMLVVLAVIALGTALTIPSMGGARDRMRLRSAAGKTAASLRHARSRAISEQRIMQAFFDLENRRLLVRPWPRYRGLSGPPAFGGGDAEYPPLYADDVLDETNDPDASPHIERKKIFSLPDDIRYADPRTFRGVSVPGDRFQITFFPGGGSNGGSIRIRPENSNTEKDGQAKMLRVRVDLITGLISVSDEDASDI